MKALVVIDIDNYCGWKQKYLKKDVTQRTVALKIQKTLCQARSASIPIIFVVFPHCEVKPTSAWRNRISQKESRKHLPAFLGHRYDEEPVFFKNSCNAFENPQFGENLRIRGIDELLLAGCSTFICVQSAALGAVSEGFKVYILENCIHPQIKSKNEKVSLLNLINDKCGEKNLF